MRGIQTACAVAVLAAALAPTVGTAGRSVAEREPASSRTSHAVFVTPACRALANARACRVALRYLAALDLDHAGQACRLLAPSTLEAAGGMRRCKRLLLGARGIRIRYAIDGVLGSPLGRTVRFWTEGESEVRVRQQMLVSPAGRIVAVVPEP